MAVPCDGVPAKCVWGSENIVKLKKLFCLVTALLTGGGIFAFSACEEKTTEADFSILTWNVYLGNGDGGSVVALIEDKMPDIIHMQEANPGAYSKFINPFIEENPYYTVLDTKIENETLRTPILYNTDKFTLIDSGAEMLKDSYTVTKTKTLAWALLETKNGEKLLSVNFHGVKCLEKYEDYKDCTQEERDTVEEEWHIGNVVQLIANIDDALLRHGSCNVVITGDCNFDSASGAYKMLVAEGYKDAEISAKQNTQDGMRTSHTLGTEFSREGLTIDHVYSDALLLTHEIIRSREAYMGSDHCPVFVTAAFNNRK